jgi:hypothetical protein
MFTALLGLLTGAFAADDLLLNRAGAEEFASLPGIDQGLGEQIVALRTERGRLNSVEELRILGLQDATLDTLRANTAVDLAVGSSDKKTYTTVEEVMASFAHEPDILEVQTMAMEYTHTNRDQVERWLGAARNAAWLPELTLRYTYDNDTDLDYNYLSQTELEYEEGNEKWLAQYYVQAKWKLDELVMSSEQIRVIGEAQDVVKLRDKVLGEITRLYFDRRRLQTDLLLSPPSDLKSQVEDQLRLMELTAELDAYTGGRFSASIQ